jgi:large subunit ribosomal protein L14
MIRAGSKLPITDNSGARIIKVIKIYKKTPFSKIAIGNLFLGALQVVKLHRKSRLKKLFKKELKKSVILRLNIKTSRRDGSAIRFFENSGILVDKKKKPIATRIKGFVSVELKKQKRFKVIMLAGGARL